LIGKYDFSQTHWLRALNNYLLVKVEPQKGLKDAIEEFDRDCFKRHYEKNKKDLLINNVKDPVPEIPLLYLLLKAYANVDNIPEEGNLDKLAKMRTAR
jgi:hypothetical protein